MPRSAGATVRGALSGQPVFLPDVNVSPMPVISPEGPVLDGARAPGFDAAALSAGHPNACSHRRRFGLLLPATNTTMESELWTILVRNRDRGLDGIGIHSSPVLTPKPDLGTPAGLERYRQDFLAGVADALASAQLARPQYLLMSMSLEHILAGIEPIRATMAQLAQGCNLSWSMWHDAAKAALDRYGARRIGLITPFQGPANESAARMFRDLGFDVVTTFGFCCGNAQHIAHIPDEAKERAITELLATPANRLDAVVQCGTNMSMPAGCCASTERPCARRWDHVPSAAAGPCAGKAGSRFCRSAVRHVGSGHERGSTPGSGTSGIPARESRARHILYWAPSNAAVRRGRHRTVAAQGRWLYRSDEVRCAAVSRPGSVPQQSAPLGSLRVAQDFAAVEVLVRGGVDTNCICVLQGQDEALAREAAERGRSSGAGPVPARPHVVPWRTLVVIPTYNEKDNLEAIVHAVWSYVDVDILIVDDGSPDGTGAIAERLATEDRRLRVIHRADKLGLGTAYLEGFRHAMKHGYERVCEMDADFSHAPWDLPRLVHASAEADLVIGSRYVTGGCTVGWDLMRRLLSRGANLYARTVLASGICDNTAGFRCFQTSALEQLDLSSVQAQGYAFQIEMAFRMARAGFRVREIPVHFVDRRVGKSKMNGRIAREALLLVLGLRWRVPRQDSSRRGAGQAN